MVAEGQGGSKVVPALLAEVCRNPLDRVKNLNFGEPGESLGGSFYRGNSFFDGRVIFAESGRRLNRLAENIALSETRQIVRRKPQPQLMSCTMGA
jgi:hypothetical protein